MGVARGPPQAGRRGGGAARRRGGGRRGRGKPPRAREGRRSGRERGKPDPRGKPNLTTSTAARGRGKPEPHGDEHRAAQRGANPTRRTHKRRRAAPPTAVQPMGLSLFFRARKKGSRSSPLPSSAITDKSMSFSRPKPNRARVAPQHCPILGWVKSNYNRTSSSFISWRPAYQPALYIVSL